MADTPRPHPPVRTFDPRRRRLAPSRQAAFDRMAQRWCLAEIGRPLDLAAEFGRDGDRVLEIGIGLGNLAIEMAVAEPEFDVIGCDVYTPGIAHALSEIERLGLDNLRLVHGDALTFIARLEPGSLAGIRLFFPDPWPKVRHHHRRLVQPETVARLVELLRGGGWLHLATDIADYAAQMQAVCNDHPELVGGVIERPPLRPITRYEQRGLDAGHVVTDLWYQRAP